MVRRVFLTQGDWPYAQTSSIRGSPPPIESLMRTSTSNNPKIYCPAMRRTDQMLADYHYPFLLDQSTYDTPIRANPIDRGRSISESPWVVASPFGPLGHVTNRLCHRSQ